MATDPITQSLTSTSSTSASGSTLGTQTLGKDDFLKLLVGQLQHQDPMAPSDDQQWIGQMAQFSQLEQITNMAASNQKIVDALSRNSTLSLIGRTVTYLDSAGAAQTGTVQQVDLVKDGSSLLTVDGRAGIDATSVTEVR